MRYQTGIDSDRNRSIGIILANLGTPDAPDSPAVRKFLAQFLHDHRVVELHRMIWCPILHGIILRFRPKRSATAYQKIWSPEGSPLLTIARRQTDLISDYLQQKIELPLYFELGMRYGNPSIGSALKNLAERGTEQILILPRIKTCWSMFSTEIPFMVQDHTKYFTQRSPRPNHPLHSRPPTELRTTRFQSVLLQDPYWPCARKSMCNESRLPGTSPRLRKQHHRRKLRPRPWNTRPPCAGQPGSPRRCCMKSRSCRDTAIGPRPGTARPRSRRSHGNHQRNAVLCTPRTGPCRPRPPWPGPRGPCWPCPRRSTRGGGRPPGTSHRPRSSRRRRCTTTCPLRPRSASPHRSRSRPRPRPWSSRPPCAGRPGSPRRCCIAHYWKGDLGSLLQSCALSEAIIWLYRPCARLYVLVVPHVAYYAARASNHSNYPNGLF